MYVEKLIPGTLIPLSLLAKHSTETKSPKLIEVSFDIQYIQTYLINDIKH